MQHHQKMNILCECEFLFLLQDFLSSTTNCCTCSEKQQKQISLSTLYAQGNILFLLFCKLQLHFEEVLDSALDGGEGGT